jgi:hypothetical protein
MPVESSTLDRVRVGQHRAAALYSEMSRYSSSLLINKLRNDLSLQTGDAEALFEDVKRFMALCASTTLPLAPPRIVDQAWHHFILQTKDYANFCDKYCGRFIHHHPADPFSHTKDYGVDRQRTRELAEDVFGALSDNWSESLGTGSCTHNCGTGD